MNKINLIIAKRNRDDYLSLVLHNFNLSNQHSKHDVVVYIGEDIKENINKLDYSKYHNLKIEHIYVPNLAEARNLFCRGHIMNVLMQKMRQDYDFVCVADTDMVYRNDFFEQLSTLLKSGDDMESCLIAKGVYTEDGTDCKKILEEKIGYDEIVRDTSWKNFATNSQISLTRAYHEHLKKVLGTKSIFDAGGLGQNYIGYGGEDTLAKRILQSSKVKVIFLANAWIHVWHERQEVAKETKKRNKNLTKLLLREAIQRLKAGDFYTNRYLRKIEIWGELI